MDEPVDQMDQQTAAKLHLAGVTRRAAARRGTGGPPPAPMCATVERTRKSETATLIKLHAEQPTRGQRSSSTPAMCADNDEASLDVDDVVARAVNAQRQFAGREGELRVLAQRLPPPAAVRVAAKLFEATD